MLCLTGGGTLNINLTLIVQMLVFAAFVWFTMRFVWPPLVRAMDERQAIIVAGLSAAERGQKELELSQHRVKEDLKQAKVDVAEILEKANRRAVILIDEAKEQALHEAKRVAQVAQEQLLQEVSRAKESLRQQVAVLAVAGAEKILMREIDQQENQVLLDRLIEEM